MDLFLAWLPWLVIGAGVFAYMVWDGSPKQLRRRRERRTRSTRPGDDDTRFERGWGTQDWDDF